MEEYRTFWRRFWASIIDAVAINTLLFIPGRLDDFLLDPERNGLVIFLWSLVTSVLSLAYFIFLHAHFGQTVGKMVTKVKVLDVSETALPSYRQAFLRDILPVGTTVIYLIGLLISLANGTYTYVSWSDATESTSVELTWSEQLVIYASLAWMLIEIVTMLANKKRRAIHDFIAGTVVVKTSEHDI